MVLFDSHIHIGQFRDLYSTPQDVFDFLTKVGVDRFAVSSTTTCEGDYAKVVGELKYMQKLAGNRMVPVLWLLPQVLYDGTIERMINSGINWQCLKIHSQLHQEFWKTEEAQADIVSVAKEMKLPLLIHTGEWDGCYPEHFENTIADNPEVLFILAHSRPVEQAIDVMRHCPNAWADCAFTPPECVSEMIKCGFADRIMFGTDYPLHNVFYAGENMEDLYLKIVDGIKGTMSEAEWELVSHKNFERLFGKI
jgi:predicted TIM-barrel fold metal-dependent hydrolase